MRVDIDTLPPEHEFKPYRKTSVTLMAGPFDPPLEVITREGTALVADGPAFVALDADGVPYPVDATVVERTYELVEDAA